MFRFPTEITGNVIAIGDVHGQLENLKSLWKRIEKRLTAKVLQEDYTVCFLGDYVDRGPRVRETLDFLISLYKSRPAGKTTFIAGNHDLSCAYFLGLLPPPPGETFRSTWDTFEYPDELWEGEAAVVNNMHLQGRRWGRWAYDAWSTFESYGVAHGDRSGLLNAMPQEHVEFLRALPWVVEHPDYLFVHGGLDAHSKLDELRKKNVMDPRPAPLCDRHFWKPPPVDVCRKTIVSGHVQVPSVRIVERRIMVDTSGGCDRKMSAVLLPSNFVICSEH